MEGSSADDKTPRGRNVAHARGGNMGGTFPMRSPGKAGAGGGQQQHQHRDKKGHHHYHHSKHVRFTALHFKNQLHTSEAAAVDNHQVTLSPSLDSLPLLSIPLLSPFPLRSPPKPPSPEPGHAAEAAAVDNHRATRPHRLFTCIPSPPFYTHHPNHLHQNLGTLQKLLQWIPIRLLSPFSLEFLPLLSIPPLSPFPLRSPPKPPSPEPGHAAEAAAMDNHRVTLPHRPRPAGLCSFSRLHLHVYFFMCPETIKRLPEHRVKLESDPVHHDWVSAVLPFDCLQAHPFYIFMCPETIKRLPEHCVKLESDPVQHDWVSAVLPFDCLQAPQSSPVIAHRVDDVKYDFFLSLLDFPISPLPFPPFSSFPPPSPSPLPLPPLPHPPAPPHSYIFMCPETIKRLPEHCVKLESDPVQHDWVSAVLPFDCFQAPQSSPVIAHRVDDVKYDFFLSLLDFGTRRRPNRNMVRLMEDRPFLKPELAVAMQSVLEMLIEAKAVRPDSLVIDAGAGIGGAAFAAAAMGVRVLALDPVLANVLKMCDAVHLNRVSKRVKLHLAAVSDSVSNITIHNILSNLEHSAVTAAVLTLASKDAPVIPTTVESLPIDSLVLPDQHVAVLKVTVQGWELHAFRGAAGLLSRPPKEAPCVLYEEDRMLLRAGNTTPAAVRGFLAGYGYSECDQAHGLVHCRKKGSLLDA
ncbi:unnamed protein product [Closterium sp. Naga37s-1]|nr:unnamed protein product [Closterium sp. Naga37s-1]CAI5501916.1 unnamed protein product [Closterium sp. Naga37s-1]